MRKFLMYNSRTKKFTLKVNGKEFNHSFNKHGITTEHMQKAQDFPDLWVLVEYRVMPLLDQENEGIFNRGRNNRVPLSD